MLQCQCQVKRSSAFLLLPALFSMLHWGLHTSRYNAALVVAREGFVGCDLLISALTHTYSVCEHTFSSGMSLHTVGCNHLCAAYIKSSLLAHFCCGSCCSVKLWMLRFLISVQNVSLLYLLSHSLLFSTVLCSIEIAPIQSWLFMS